jgi:hypothetical protein
MKVQIGSLYRVKTCSAYLGKYLGNVQVYTVWNSPDYGQGSTRMGYVHNDDVLMFLAERSLDYCSDYQVILTNGVSGWITQVEPLAFGNNFVKIA